MTLLERIPRETFHEGSIPVLETKRLALRAPRLEDAKTVATLANDRRIAENTARIPHPYKMSDAEGFITGANKAGGESVLAGNILARQRGTKWHPGRNVGIGKDHTLFALVNGKVQFATKTKGRTYVSIVPMTENAAE